MRFAYKDGNPIAKITVIGSKEEREYDAYLDTGAIKTLIPEDDAFLLVYYISGTWRL